MSKININRAVLAALTLSGLVPGANAHRDAPYTPQAQSAASPTEGGQLAVVQIDPWDMNPQTIPLTPDQSLQIWQSLARADASFQQLADSGNLLNPSDEGYVSGTVRIDVLPDGQYRSDFVYFPENFVSISDKKPGVGELSVPGASLGHLSSEHGEHDEHREDREPPEFPPPVGLVPRGEEDFYLLFAKILAGMIAQGGAVGRQSTWVERTTAAIKIGALIEKASREDKTLDSQTVGKDIGLNREHVKALFKFYGGEYVRKGPIAGRWRFKVPPQATTNS